MATVKMLTDEEASPEARAVFVDIRKTRNSDFVNNAWRAQANDPANLKRTWEKAKEVMGPRSPNSNRYAHYFDRYTRWRGDGGRVPVRSPENTEFATNQLG